MKDHAPESWIDLRRMPPGRRQWAFRQVGERLAESDTELRALCDAGAAAEAEQLALMLRFKGDQSAKDPTRVWPRAVVDLDAALDRQGGLRSVAGVRADGKVQRQFRFGTECTLSTRPLRIASDRHCCVTSFQYSSTLLPLSLR